MTSVASPLSRRLPSPLFAIAATAIVVAGCLSSSSPSPSTPDGTGEPAPARRPVIIDADMDISDLAAIAILLRDPELDVRAIAIDGTGLVHCAGGMTVTRYLLDEMGTPDIPFGCGREDGGPDAHPFPDEWRVVADDAYGMDIVPRPSVGLPDDAATVLAEAIAGSPSAPTIVALGPWTNLEDAFAADPGLADQVAGIHAMLGTVAAPGNVYTDTLDGDDPLEWNAYADPSAVEAVFATDVPIDLVPLDATDDVPVPADLPERLAEDLDAAGADIVHELLLRHPPRLVADQGQQLWDELAALAVSQPDLVTWEQADLVAGADGRITPDDAGRAVRFAAAADREATEAALLEALRRGGPRAHPFQLKGTIDITWDGTTCAATVDPAGDVVPGVYQLRYTGQAGAPSGGVLVGVDETASWSDVGDFLLGLDPETETEEPSWLRMIGQAADEAGTGETVTVTAAVTEAGTYGPVCLTGMWPDITFTAGEPIGG
jgi:inosine-uridine nucleoside N-ribohydrolase